MRRTYLATLGIIAISFVVPSSAQAQGPWTFEVRAGASVPTDSFVSTDLGTGVGFEGTIGYRILPALSVFGGWDWQHRQFDAPVFDADDVEDTGYVYGLRFTPGGGARVKPFIRLAGLWNHVELETNDGHPAADSKHTWGYEAGAGLDISFNESVSLTPGVRYRSFEPTVRFGNIETDATLSYVTVDVGVAWKF
jgi:opacity protein-like surface antigen